jgi:LysR family transcriptional regulator, glycine cleavage system transcriptional activator
LLSSQAKLIMRPSLESLRILEACVSSGSFVRAAGRLFLTPAAVSLRIRTLEAELGEALFIRHGPRVVATPKAAALALGVRRGLNEIDESLDVFGAALLSLRVTAPPTFATRWLAPRLSHYTHGEIVLDVSSEVRDQATFDVAVRTGSGDWPGLEIYRLFPVQLTPLMAPSLAAQHAPPLTAEDLARLPLLPHPEWERWFRQAIGAVPPALTFARVEYPSHELNVNAACSGQGVALVPSGFYETLLEAGLLIAPFSCVLDGPDWHFALVRRDDGRLGPRDFCTWLCEESRVMGSALDPFDGCERY